MQCKKIAPLFDHLVGAEEQHRRNGEAEVVAQLTTITAMKAK